MVTAQSAAELHLAGYTSQEVWIEIQVPDGAGQKTVPLLRHLTQLGFGEPVTRVAAGQVFDMPILTKKMVAKLHPE
eukprot:4151559-Amphidinium_carterae.1